MIVHCAVGMDSPTLAGLISSHQLRNNWLTRGRKKNPQMRCMSEPGKGCFSINWRRRHVDEAATLAWNENKATMSDASKPQTFSIFNTSSRPRLIQPSLQSHPLLRGLHDMFRMFAVCRVHNKNNNSTTRFVFEGTQLTDEYNTMNIASTLTRCYRDITYVKRTVSCNCYV